MWHPFKFLTLSTDKLRASESPAPSSAASHPDESEYQEPEVSQYHLVFSDFFLKGETTLAPFTYFQRDQEATEITKHSMDGYLDGSKSPGRVREYDALSLFHLPNIPKRGRAYMAVAEIFAGITGTASQVVGGASQVIDLTLEDQNAKILESRDILKRTPMKILQFQEDVRPPYRGTYTRTPLNGVAALARNPFRRDLPDQNYDNDSEAEWVEDDDDAEDLNDEDDDEEDEDDEDMEDFLDDENDENAPAKRRLVLQSDIEPVSTGLCWEDRHKQNPNVKMMPFRMEVILGEYPIFDIESHANSHRFETQIHRPILLVLLGAITKVDATTPTSIARYECTQHQSCQDGIGQIILHAHF